MTATPITHPDSATTEPARPLAGADLCVHCGFCLQACPTYLTLDDENDSPRGRIVLMKALVGHEVAELDAETMLGHLNGCLGCRACETACPAGVPYGQLLEETRAMQHEHHALPWISRLVLFVFARPALLGAAMLGARVTRAVGLSKVLARAPGRIGIAFANLEATRRPASAAGATHASPATAASPANLAHPTHPRVTKGSVAILTGCVMEGLLAPVNRATERVLARNRYELRHAAGQRCCGALHAHAGQRAEAQALARANIAAFEASGVEWIAVNSAGCGSAMKEYGHLLADDPAWRDRAAAFAGRVRDVSELLADAGPAGAAVAGEGSMQVAVDHPCHLLHGQRISSQPARVLAGVAGLEARDLPGAETCCGSAGLYSLAQPEMSQRILAPKLAEIAASGASVVVTGNPGCLMHIRAGLIRAGIDVETRHPVEMLDAAYRHDNQARS